MKRESGTPLTSIGTLRDAFLVDRGAAEKSYLGRMLTVEATVLRTGTSMYATPIVEASDRPGGTLVAVFVLPFGRESEASFERLKAFHPGDRILVTGECRMMSEPDGVLVFKDCVIEVDHPVAGPDSIIAEILWKS